MGCNVNKYKLVNLTVMLNEWEQFVIVIPLTMIMKFTNKNGKQ